MRLVRTLTVIFAGSAVFALAACGGGSDYSTPAANAAPSGAATQVSTPPGGAATVAATQGSGGGGTSTGSAKLPDDPCKLLAKSDLDTLSTAMGEGKATQDGVATARTVSCRWEWQDSSQTLGIYDVEVRVLSLPSNIPAAQAKVGMQVELRDAGGNGAEVPGVGDYAVFISVINGTAEGRALIKNVLLEVQISGPNARQQKDKAIALLKAAASRL